MMNISWFSVKNHNILLKEMESVKIFEALPSKCLVGAVLNTLHVTSHFILSIGLIIEEHDWSKYTDTVRKIGIEAFQIYLTLYVVLIFD